MTTCKQCSLQFEVTPQDLSFYAKVSPVFAGKKYQVLAPTLCPDCRQQRRLAFRNERKLYNRICNICKQPFISIYSPDKVTDSGKALSVYCTKCWWSDQWDPMTYGQEYDFSQTFFSQWKKLWQTMPRLGLLVWGDGINSDYTHDVIKCVNSYLIFDGEQAQECFYGETFHTIKDCVDFLKLRSCELGYEIIDCINCYNIQHSRFSENCSDSYFLLDCIGCKNCFGCVNLRQKEYYIFNQPFSKEEYQKFITNAQLGNYQNREAWRMQAETFFASQPKKAYRGRMNENSTGNSINNCQNAFDSFDSNGLRDSRFCTNIMLSATDCYDVDTWGESTSLIYNSAMVGLGSQQMIGGYYTCFDSHDIYHSAFCWQGCNNLFGCVGLKHKEFCILNKQYSKEQYLELVPKIIENMQSNGEWAEFFPPMLSAFGYNETVANEYYPLSREEALKKGFLWSDYEAPKPAVKKTLKAAELPIDIQSVSDEILDYAIVCEVSGKLFRIIKAELNFYRQHNIPLPHRHPDQRHSDRMQLRPPRKLWSRKCMQCQMAVSSPYGTDRPERILCENCYSDEL
ncbi:MAG: hypothetical protein HY817_04190 [Candidatus Abawacabacteria bacterium]|nr:hypothetical protein [Candidatus Abawacabacteria bacterium]